MSCVRLLTTKSGSNVEQFNRVDTTKTRSFFLTVIISLVDHRGFLVTLPSSSILKNDRGAKIFFKLVFFLPLTSTSLGKGNETLGFIVKSS